jgi:hypothetical protein
MTIRSPYSIIGASLAVLLTLPAMAAAQPPKAVPVERGQTPASMGVRGFSVVLVIGGTQGPSSSVYASDNVPEAARKALADMKDFLPYKRYQLLDAAWILCCAPNTTSDRSADQVSGIVHGQEGRNYIYAIDPGDVVGSKLNLRFTMRELQDPAPAARSGQQMSDVARLEQQRQLYEAIKERDDADIQYRSAKQKFDVGVVGNSELETATSHLRRAEQRVLELQRLGGGTGSGGASGAGFGGVASGATAGARGGGSAVSASGRASMPARNLNIMDSTFSIALGETVVIGTSRLNGDQALIAILTAAPKPGVSR